MGLGVVLQFDRICGSIFFFIFHDLKGNSRGISNSVDKIGCKLGSHGYLACNQITQPLSKTSLCAYR